MKQGKYAIYLGKEYASGINREGKVILRSDDFEDIKNGFELCEPFKYKDNAKEIVCIKYVNPSEVD